MDEKLQAKVTIWRELWKAGGDADALVRREKLEREILRWKPMAPDEADAVAEVLEKNVMAGQRVDRADLTAVRNLRAFVRSREFV